MTVTDVQVAAFCSGVLTQAGLPQSQNAVVSLIAQAFAEGGWQINDAEFNPLDTTQPMPGSREINSVGVQAYTSELQGQQATAKTLLNGYYPAMVACLRAGEPPDQYALLVGNSPWGTERRLMLEVMSRAQNAYTAWKGSQPKPTPPPIPKVDGQRVIAGMFYTPNPQKTGDWLVYKTNKASVPKQSDLVGLKAHGVPEKVLNQTQITALKTVSWGAL